jgi:hypothetical protein
LSESVRVVDVAGIPIRFEASDLSRARAVESGLGALAPVGAPARMSVAFGSSYVALPDRPWDHADGEVRAWWDADELRLAHGRFSCLVTKTSAIIGGEGEPERAFRQIVPYVLSHLLAGQQRFLLHAAAIEREGEVLLVLGPSGSGKSSLVVGALRGGWKALADDLVVLRDAGTPEVCGIAKPIAGPAEVVRSSGLACQSLDGDPRGRWLVAHDPTPGWFRVAGTLICAHDTGVRSSVQPLSSAGLVESLLLSFLSAKQPAALRDFLPVAAAVTCRRGWTLSQSRIQSERLKRIDDLLRQRPVFQPHG